MKVIKLNTVPSLKATEKLLAAILKRDIHAFKATSKQFLKNNQAYYNGLSGITA